MKLIDLSNKDSIDLACDFLKRGEIISFPTETVYGLACDAANEKAIDKIFKLKNRDYSKPIAIFLEKIEQAQKILQFNDIANIIAKKYLPGAVTIVLPKKNNIDIYLASNLNLNDNYLAFRISDDPFVAKLLAKFDGIIAVTSANISGFNSSIHHDQVKNFFMNSDLGLLIKGGYCRSQIASTVVKIYENDFEILRQGLIKIDI